MLVNKAEYIIGWLIPVVGIFRRGRRPRKTCKKRENLLDSVLAKWLIRI